MTNTRINASLNTAKEIINALMNSEEIFYDRTEGNELSGRFNVQMTFAESICYRPQYTVRKLRNLVLNRHGSLSIRTRIALAAVLSQCEFDTHENALIPVLFTRNEERVDEIYETMFDLAMGLGPVLMVVIPILYDAFK